MVATSDYVSDRQPRRFSLATEPSYLCVASLMVQKHARHIDLISCMRHHRLAMYSLASRSK